MSFVLNYFNLTFSKIKWIYRKYNLKARKVKTKSKRHRPAFNSVFFDWWIEFVSNSPNKLKQWNNLFSHFNTTCFLYDWPNDFMKNPIERSHKIDDEEFLIPRWYYINSKEDFINEASRYSHYYNFKRISSSEYRYWKTSFQIISEYLKPYFYKYLVNFPTLILDNCISDLIYHTKTIDTLLHHLLNNPPDFSNPKSVLDFKHKFNIQNNFFAQNVFDLYLKEIPYNLVVKKIISVLYSLKAIIFKLSLIYKKTHFFHYQKWVFKQSYLIASLLFIIKRFEFSWSFFNNFFFYTIWHWFIFFEYHRIISSTLCIWSKVCCITKHLW